LVLGLDGGSFELLDSMIATGRLPNLSRLLRGGVRAVLESTLPPVTCPAWPTMFTGRNPGVHGYTSFSVMEPGTTSYRGVSLRDVACPTLWTVLNRAGVRTGIFNVPGTYPVDEVDGFMVSGFPTPPGAEAVVWPPTLRSRFQRVMPGYDCAGVVQNLLSQDLEARRAVAQRLKEILQMRAEALEWFLDQEPVEFLWVVLETVDRLSHAAYAYLVRSGPGFDRPEGEAIRAMALEVLEKQDEVIGRVLGRLDSDAAVLVVSDHGFTWASKQFHLPRWLAEAGYMVRPAGWGLRDRLRPALRRTLRRLLPRRVREGVRRAGEQRLAQTVAERVNARWDWARSRAFPAPYCEWGVYINTKDRHPDGPVGPGEYDGVVEALVADLQSATDPESGAPIMGRVERRDRVYHGPYAGRMPDVFFLPSRGIVHRCRSLPGTERAEGWLTPLPHYYNFHEIGGILAATGGPFGTGTLASARIVDVMPTVLYAMGLEVPADLEGRVLEEAFSESFRSANPLRHSEGAGESSVGPDEASVYSAEDEAAIQQRLEELGYL